MPRLILVAAMLLVFASPDTSAAQDSREPGDPLRMAIIVDNSEAVRDDLPQMRRALQQFLDALPPNHELMLVTTGGQMNIRVPPTRDYLEILEGITEIHRQTLGGNAMIGTIEEIYDRYLRTVERRYPMMVILTSDANDVSQRITQRSLNALLQGLTRTGVIVNAVFLTSSGVGLVRNVVLEFVKRTGGAHESVVISTALPGRMKILASRVAEQYRKLSPGRNPVDPRK